MSDRILGVLAKMVDATIQTDFVFDRWNYIIDAMIENIPGHPLLNKLGAIHLIEADLNLSLVIIWSRSLLTQGEKFGAFGDEP